MFKVIWQKATLPHLAAQLDSFATCARHRWIVQCPQRWVQTSTAMLNINRIVPIIYNQQAGRFPSKVPFPYCVTLPQTEKWTSSCFWFHILLIRTATRYRIYCRRSTVYTCLPEVVLHRLAMSKCVMPGRGSRLRCLKWIQQPPLGLHSAETQVELRTQKSRQACCVVPPDSGSGQAPPAAKSWYRIQRGEQPTSGVADDVLLTAESNQHTNKTSNRVVFYYCRITQH